jgi:dTDP-4-dehydrorhamnose 3,5-epimerase
VISEWALFSYMCDEIYSPQTELSVRFDDPDLAIAWPQLEFRLSEKDEAAPLLKDIDERRLPVFGEV